MRTYVVVFLISLMVLASVVGPGHAAPPEPDAVSLDARVEALRVALSAQERVAQLMLVTFEGATLAPDMPLARLIAEYNIGGVVLLAENDNINGQVNTPRLVQALTTSIQQMAYDASLSGESRTGRHTFVPLFIATHHAGNKQPGTAIALGTTPLPSTMALGATWNPDNARLVGQIAGSELSAMGVNMLLGPDLSVFQQSQAGRAFDLGVNSFGGEPYWVGRMGQAYITGVHEGSQGHVAVIAGQFPGLGLVDTSPDEQIPVLPRSVDDLRQVDLVPFFAVTGKAGNTLARAEGIQCTNVRYLSENTRALTRPLCLDEQAADHLLSLDDLRDWRARGVMVSSSLGSQAVRRYYSTTPFPHRQVAREAFLAGNDILLLADFGPTPGADQFSNVTDVIKFFGDRYENDPVFRAQVDQSLTRVLRLKLTLYDGDISYENVLSLHGDIDTVGTSTAGLYAIAQQGITLIAPRRDSLPPPPARQDSIVIFTDVRLVQQCSTCAAYPLVTVNALESAIERMYGPQAGAQIRPEQVASFSFSQLQDYLHGDFESLDPSTNQFKTAQRIGEALRSVDWIVFVMLDSTPAIPASGVVREFLEGSPDLVERAHVVVVALGAPIYLSSTEIGKLSAYYGLHSLITPYLDTAARALFQESGLAGALPISLPAVGYDLDSVTNPTPNQIIRLEAASVDGRAVPAAARTPDGLIVRLGERLVLRTLPIVDHNGNPVPDDTPVEFAINFLNDNLQSRQVGRTVDGVASTSLTPSQTGRIHVNATSKEAVQAATFQLIAVDTSSVELPAGGQITETPEEALTLAPSPEATLAPVDAPASASGSKTGTTNRSLSVIDLALALFGLALMSGLAFAVGVSASLSIEGGIRVVLGCVVAGLTGYIYYGINGPGARQISQMVDAMAPMMTTLVAALVGMIYAWWSLRFERRR